MGNHHSPLEGESDWQGRRPPPSRWGGLALACLARRLALLLPLVWLPAAAAAEAARLPGALLPADILPVDEAFRPGLRASPDARTVFWQIRPGYYLFREKLSARGPADQPLPLDLPPGQPRVDAALGQVQVYDRYVEASLPPGEGSVTLRYQGCAESGYCYPPVEKSLLPAQ